jgi:hypothetical protein
LTARGNSRAPAFQFLIRIGREIRMATAGTPMFPDQKAFEKILHNDHHIAN